MSMTGNPHYRNALDQFDAVEDMTVQEVLQAEATLALAFEQRPTIQAIGGGQS